MPFVPFALNAGIEEGSTQVIALGNPDGLASPKDYSAGARIYGLIRIKGIAKAPEEVRFLPVPVKTAREDRLVREPAPGDGRDAFPSGRPGAQRNGGGRVDRPWCRYWGDFQWLGLVFPGETEPRVFSLDDLQPSD